MNKKFKILALLTLVLTITISTCRYANADDTASNVEFVARKDKVTCVSIADLENLEDGYFLLFDYSSDTGMSLGRPWAVVEKGKCYEIDKTGGTMYLVKGGSEEKLKFSSYKNFKPEQNIEYVGYVNSDNKYGGLSHSTYSFDEIIIPVFPPDYDYSMGESGQDHYLQVVYLPSLIPTKYSFGERITYSSSLNYEEVSKGNDEYANESKLILNIIKDSRYNKEIYNMYLGLSKDLESTINKCDNRLRVEYQMFIVPQIQMQIWKLKDGTQTYPAGFKYRDELSKITQIGCTEAYKDFIQKNTLIINQIDQLAQQILKDNKVVSVRSTISSNNQNAGKISDFIAGNVTSEYDQFSENYKLDWLPEFLKNKTGMNATLSTPAEISKEEPQVTTLDEPTEEKKSDIVSNSSNMFVKAYIWLPLVALIGIIVFLLRKRQK